jgi:ABC-type Fe3+/spermidine/putrescine transport system ATPase subunit
MSATILELDRITKRFGATFAADALSLTVQKGEFFTFLGPSGSGKSTVLRVVAGLEAPDSGTVRIDGQDVAAIAPWDRNLGMMFQNYAVFPHMTVRMNVGYGLKARRRPAGEIKERVDAILELVGLASLAEKNVTLLSGGEQQRVALARALVPEPRMLLLDEPLSALDEKIRRAMQTELKHVHRRTGTTFLYVTHDQEEALTLSDRIAVINRGRCVQCDAPEHLYKRPRRRFVAEFFRGCNVLEAELAGQGNGAATYRLAGIGIDVPLAGVETPGRHVALRAENVHLGVFAQPHPCRLSATLLETTFRGTVRDYRLALPDGQTLTATMTQHLDAAPGSTVELGFSPQAIIALED